IAIGRFLSTASGSGLAKRPWPGGVQWTPNAGPLDRGGITPARKIRTRVPTSPKRQRVHSRGDPRFTRCRFGLVDDLLSCRGNIWSTTRYRAKNLRKSGDAASGLSTRVYGSNRPPTRSDTENEGLRIVINNDRPQGE